MVEGRLTPLLWSGTRERSSMVEVLLEWEEVETVEEAGGCVMGRRRTRVERAVAREKGRK